MPLTRNEARRALNVLLQTQVAREREFGPLLAALWTNPSDSIEDIELVEVYERFRADDGTERGVYRFPGFADLWLPGLYIVTIISEAALSADLTLRADLAAHLADGRAERIFPPPGRQYPLLDLI